MARLVGTCNFCIACCFGRDGSHCEHLEITGVPGQPYAGLCTIYEKRYDKMPIAMISKDGERVEGKYYCAKDSPAETKTIIEMGIMTGKCSLRIE